jgi:hypothetical protein
VLAITAPVDAPPSGSLPVRPDRREQFGDIEPGAIGQSEKFVIGKGDPVMLDLGEAGQGEAGPATELRQGPSASPPNGSERDTEPRLVRHPKRSLHGQAPVIPPGNRLSFFAKLRPIGRGHKADTAQAAAQAFSSFDFDELRRALLIHADSDAIHGERRWVPASS